MATIDEDLSQIERDIRTLKIEYDQFFGGGRPRPPADTQWRVESLMRRVGERTAELNSGQRFRYHNISQTYAKYVEMWRKKTLQKETGFSQRHFGAAAKAIEAERARAAANQPAPVAAAVVSEPALAGAHAKQGDAAFALSFSDPDREHEKVETLYRKLIEARTEAGEKTEGPSLKDFQRFVQQKSKELREKGGQDVEYTVNVEGGRVKLKARIAR
jgi:hypothetical protein